MSTLTRYRQLNDPKPLVVGIAWVVECAEQARRADETKFLVNLEGVNVAGANKVRICPLWTHSELITICLAAPSLNAPKTPDRFWF